MADSSNAGWQRDTVITCDNDNCGFMTSSGKEAMQHSYETMHSLTGEGPFEGSTLTVSLVREDSEEPKEERQAQAFSMLRDAAEVPPTVDLSDG